MKDAKEILVKDFAAAFEIAKKNQPGWNKTESCNFVPAYKQKQRCHFSTFVCKSYCLLIVTCVVSKHFSQNFMEFSSNCSIIKRSWRNVRKSFLGHLLSYSGQIIIKTLVSRFFCKRNRSFFQWFCRKKTCPEKISHDCDLLHIPIS